eukprot:CAMPEP_0197673538 /NCGR_PEP_ID=MMETSP1338-20131121/81150_1 /TAXON_ID=43686 ORGANISM="Pelagodinium beii, Strain RCC1491" /NCGR_SAMPLE_ID=MMETSP1338 /ASSEMBLY_ACC=CAM_ASM_000754 /LENGTH=77 /DNA_ID=CAMNT_0043253805 /DNA_START=233 /DNA_END=466 /DNA_ORIENTATION=-
MVSMTINIALKTVPAQRPEMATRDISMWMSLHATTLQSMSPESKFCKSWLYSGISIALKFTSERNNVLMMPIALQDP